MVEHGVWGLNRIESKYCDWTFYSSWNSLCCSDKLHFSSSLRALCSPHHERNIPAPFIVVTNRTKKCFLKMLWENPFLESCYKSGELSSYQLQDIERHQELSQTIIPTGAVVITCTVRHCRMSSLWKPYCLTFTTTKASTEFCKYHRNIFNFAWLICSRELRTEW